MEVKCVFCSKLFDADTNNQEHVLLNCLGGRLKTNKVDCSGCNNKFGIGIDNEMGKSVEQFRCLGVLRSGDGKLPPPIKDVILKDGRKIDLLAGLIPYNRTVKYERKQLLNGKLEVKFGAGSFEQLSKLLPNFAKGAGLKVEELISLIQQIDVGIQKQAITEYIPFNFAFGGLEPNRSMAKSLIVLWCYYFGDEEFHGGQFSEIKNFVVDDVFAKANEKFPLIDSRAIPFDSGILGKKDFGEHYNFMSVLTDDEGNLFGVFRMYNFVSWIFDFKGKSKHKNSNISMLSNPLSPSQWEVFHNVSLPLDVSWCKKRSYSVDQASTSFKKFMDTTSKLNQQQSLTALIEESMRDYFPSDGEIIESEHIAYFSRDIAEDYVARQFGLDRTKVVSGDRVAEILKAMLKKK